MFFLLLLVSTGIAWSQTLQEKIELLLADSPVIQRAHWGARVVDLATGEIVLTHNERHFFTPASNTKLFSTALALERLGSDYRFLTRLLAESPLHRDGTLGGNLILEGGGDPSLSGRPLPYDVKAPFRDPLVPLQEMVDSAWATGLRRVRGDIIGDDTRYVWEPYPDGWSQDDTLHQYGAAVSALTFNDNMLEVRIRPGDKAGEPARILFHPELAYFSLYSRVTTGRNGEGIRFNRHPGSRHLELWGALRANGGVTLAVAVDDPARYTAFALRELLLRRGIRVEGGIGVRHRLPGQPKQEPKPAGNELARRSSLRLAETLRVINKVSQNLHAELVLREVAYAAGVEPTRANSLEEMRRFLSRMGLASEDYALLDGSGLSRRTLLSPHAITTLLQYMYVSKQRDFWVNLMPIGGEDGTLELRFQDLPKGTIRAKTGTITNVSALGGYVQDARGRMLAFSIMVNNANAPSSEIRQFIDKLVVLVME